MPPINGGRCHQGFGPQGVNDGSGSPTQGNWTTWRVDFDPVNNSPGALYCWASQSSQTFFPWQLDGEGGYSNDLADFNSDYYYEAAVEEEDAGGGITWMGATFDGG